jgi:hypothetical protein
MPKNFISTSKKMSHHIQITLPLIALGAVSAASADTVNLDLDSYAYGSSQMISLNGSYDWDETTGSENFYNLKAYQHHWNDTTSDSMMITYCLQLYQGVDLGGNYDFTLTEIEDSPTSPPFPGAMGDQRAILLRDLYARWADPLTAGLPMAEDEMNNAATAFQILIWEITHERFSAEDADGMIAQIDLGIGALQWDSNNSAITDFANAMISSLGEGGFRDAQLLGLTNPNAQDQVSMIPAPGSLFLVSLSAIGARRTRRRH